MKWLLNLFSGYPVTVLVVACLIVLYIVLSPRVSPGLYAKKLFRTKHNLGDSARLKAYATYVNRRVSFKANDGNMMRGWYFENKVSPYVYLVHQGNSGDIARHMDIIELLLESGASVFIYEPRGFGKSGGKATIDHWLEDGVTAYDYVVDSLKYTADQIVLFGISLGTTAATYCSTQRKAAGVVLQSGFASLQKIAKQEVPFLRIYPSFLFGHKLDNMYVVTQPGHPIILFVHGLKDDFIPPDHTREMYFAATDPKSVLYLPLSNHTEVFPTDRKTYLETLTLFLAGL
jgi:fermentation-respiration switch protein FrsA (DUF1100 family)